MSTIKDLKQNLIAKQEALTSKLNDEDHENVLRLIDSNKLLQQYIDRVCQVKLIHGMNRATHILFNTSIDEL